MSGVTTKWYGELCRDSELLRSLLHSFEIEALAVSIALLFGTSAAFLVAKARFPRKEVFRALVMLPFVLSVYLYGMLRFGLSPKVYAVSGFILAFSLALILLMTRYLGRSGEEQRMEKPKR
jgi:ABC-type spermidine/putrescine transport system permease subunit II